MNKFKLLKLWVVGDCHGEIFTHFNVFRFKRDEKTFVRPMRAHFKRCLAYSLHHEGSTMKCREQLLGLLDRLSPKSDEILLSFGEIDCRCHLVGQAIKQQRPVREIVRNCVGLYMKAVKEDVLKRGFTTYIWNVPPPQQTALNEAFLRRTPYVARKRAVVLFNRFLKQECNKIGIPFLSIFEEVTDENYDRLPGFAERHSQHLLPTCLHLIAAEMERAGIGTLWTNRLIFNHLQNGSEVVGGGTNCRVVTTKQ